MRKNKHKALVGAVRHPHFSSTEKLTDKLSDEMLILKVDMVSWDSHHYTLALMTCIKIGKKKNLTKQKNNPYQLRNTERKANF